ncbi:glycerate kinase [Castellaniella sp.]|uniref:glycerate kinase type-2 family protein n=1 Tax=Castellaniella sp. TaxID=1955812 RepID=UPI0035676592
MRPDPRSLLRQLFAAAVQSAQPAHGLAAHLPAPPRGRTVVIGAGKASAAMAQALEAAWPGPLKGTVVTRYGHAVPCRQIRILEAAHPVPDAAGEQAARQLFDQVRGLGPDDLVISLISGGGSALLPLPAPGITLADKQAVSTALLRSGANIREMNCVRRHLSAIKGGRLAAACAPARVVNLLISDVPGDRPEDIASGPTVADPSTCADALEIVRRYGIHLPSAAIGRLESGAGETIKPGDPRLANVQTHLIATPQQALQAAARVARSAGITPVLLGDRIEGEAREVGKVLAGIALQVRHHAQPEAPPCVLLSGGETTVTVRGRGRGGRNVECLLSMALALDGCPGIYALMGDTDGVDGQEAIAGALLAPDSLARAWQAGGSPRAFLDDNDAHTFFERLDDALVTGPTLTNVNDFRAILIL